MSVLTPDPVLRLLERAAAHCGPGAARLHAVLAADFPAALSRRPAQLLRTAEANAEDLDQLLAMAGFADTEDLRACAARETGRRLPVPDQRIADREGSPVTAPPCAASSPGNRRTWPAPSTRCMPTAPWNSPRAPWSQAAAAGCSVT